MWQSLLAIQLLVGVDPLEIAIQVELEKLKGRWIMTSRVAGGEPLSGRQAQGTRLTCDGKKFSSVGTRGEWVIRLNPKTSPKSADLLIYRKGELAETVLFIYELDEHPLRMATVSFSDDRPLSFSIDKEKDLDVWYFVRQKD